MQLSSRIIRQILLLSMLLIIVPMIVFPELLGTSLTRASWVAIGWELVFYGVVAFAFNRKANLWHLLQAGGICLAYRLAVGTLFGLAIAFVYSMNPRVSLTFGLFSYLPGMMAQILATPFILRPLLQHWPKPERSFTRPPAEAPKTTTDAGLTSIVLTKEKVAPVEPRPFVKKERSKADDVLKAAVLPDASASIGNGFDQATSYIGEAGSVLMAAVVDRDGLLLGHFKRGDNDPEDLAPFALLFLNGNRDTLNRLSLDHPEKINISLKDHKLVLAYADEFALMVLAERQMDDILNIRINQSVEMIKKYMSNRYSSSLFENVEIDNVRSA